MLYSMLSYENTPFSQGKVFFSFQDETTLIWYSKGREKRLSLSSVSAVVLGQKTIKFLRQRCPEKESQSLSLIYKNGERSLDLICSNKDQAEYWYLGLRALLPAPCSPCSSIGSRSSRQIDSCTNTPRSYIQLKSRLPSVHSTPRHIQVYPSHRSPKNRQRFFSGGSVDYSEALFYPRQRTLSDIDTNLEKLTLKMSNPEIHGLKNIMVGNKEKDQKIPQTPKLKTFEGPRAACRLDSLKDVFFWGDVLGNTLDCDDMSKSLPRLVESTNMLDVQSIACGESHAAIITKQGEAYSWGNESSSKIGQQMNTKVSRPKLVESLTSLHVKAVAYGSKRTCAVTVSGELFEWGEGAIMGLSNDCYARNQWFRHKLFSLPDGISVAKIACGPWHTAIVTSSGQLYTYGDGTFGILGHGDTQGIARPKEVESLKGSKVKCVACGPWHTAAVVEVNEMWRAREKELELESKIRNGSSKSKDRSDSRGEKRKIDSRNHNSSSRVEQGIACSYFQEDGLGDDEIENFLHSRVKRGRGSVGSRMDEPGPYLDLLSHRKDDEPSPDIRVEEKWERRVQGPEKPLFLKSKSPDDWHKESLDGKSSSSEPRSKIEKKRKSEKKDKRDKNKKKYKKKTKHRHHHRQKSRRSE